MAEWKKLPVGLENFQEIEKSGFYYVDKTKLIEQLFENWSKVNLFTRPRRFGKTLNMSMLKSFFEIGADRTLFDGLYISRNQKLCEEYMGKYPVIFLSLKGIDGLSFEAAKYRLTELIGVEAERFAFLADSEKLTENERSKYRAIIHLVNGKYSMDEDMLVSSLQTLSQLLCRHYGQKAIILIDEYDVPLDKAFQHGYYKEMVSLIRGLFGQALKTNDDLQFAVLTGCLRVSKESIFTGLNNFKVYAADDVRYDEEFGFTNEEVKKLLANYNLQEHFEKVKEWYDGYHFGDADIYCPWDVINYVDDLLSDPNVQPKSYWINSSGNDLVKRFIEQADITTKDEIEQLIAGNAVEKRIRSDLTYDEIDNSIDNIWSVLFTTGYLTRLGKADNGVYKLIIPNQEIREWFNQIVANNRASIDKINQGFLEGKAETIQRELTMFLGETIRVFDTKARNEEKEIFYHDILLGILKNYLGWVVKSNRESGDGFADILLKPKNPDAGIIVELKDVRSLHDLDQACERALEQIKDRRYDTELREDGRNDILAYGIAFCRKRCKVVVEKL
ncbi:AAA family ATPase [Fusicatenibacter saccharivorans]|uniref:AAA family ATPase n=1 Tax=Fusicatenibacter saccharivorans TaxID=1150298 RepID=UPI00156DB7E6|nr:AAA family ATPase [Fusicatenibacter saccharivorans]NSF06920.1 AAA family ATPase [Fusicatenibacter saccharivorans]